MKLRSSARFPMDESKAPRWMFSIMSRCRKATRSMSWTMYCFLRIVPTIRRLAGQRYAVFFIAQFERFREGAPLLNVVDKKLGY